MMCRYEFYVQPVLLVDIIMNMNMNDLLQRNTGNKGRCDVTVTASVKTSA